jgi:hypothetical protein
MNVLAKCEGGGTGFAILLGGVIMRDSRLNLLLATPPAPSRRQGYELGQNWRQTVAQLLMPMGVRTFEADSGPAAVELMERHPIHLAVVDTRLPAIGGLNVLQLIQRLKEHGQRHYLGGTRAGELQAGGSRSPGEGQDRGTMGIGRSEEQTGLGRAPEGLGNNEKLAREQFAGNIPNSGEIRFEMRVETRSQMGNTQQRFEVRFESRVVPTAPMPAQVGPVVILIAPPPAEQDRALLAEALKFNAFSVLSEPVEVDVALEVMARAMKRLFCGQWPA